jgi:hypothetical protein
MQRNSPPSHWNRPGPHKLGALHSASVLHPRPSPASLRPSLQAHCAPLGVRRQSSAQCRPVHGERDTGCRSAAKALTSKSCGLSVRRVVVVLVARSSRTRVALVYCVQ